MIQLLNEAHTMATTVSVMKKHVVSTCEREGGRGKKKGRDRGRWRRAGKRGRLGGLGWMGKGEEREQEIDVEKGGDEGKGRGEREGGGMAGEKGRKRVKD